MKIQVHIKQIITHISCGDGQNTIRWLADAATIWYLQQNATLHKKPKITSPPIKICKNISEQLNMNEPISMYLENNDNVYVYFKEDVEWENLGKGK